MGPRAKREDDSCGEAIGDVPITTSDQDHENALEEDHDQRHSFIANSGLTHPHKCCAAQDCAILEAAIAGPIINYELLASSDGRSRVLSGR